MLVSGAACGSECGSATVRRNYAASGWQQAAAAADLPAAASA